MTVGRQCELLGPPRSACCCKPKARGPGLDERREAATRAIDDVRLEAPYAGARKIPEGLKKAGFDPGRRAAKAPMGEASVRPPCPKPSLPRPAKGALKRPRPLKSKRMLFPGQVWATDITHIPIVGRTCTPSR